MKQSIVVPGEFSESFSRQQLNQKVIRDILDGKAVTIFMALVTSWVLLGDDIRLIATDASADLAFYISFTVCLILFGIELILNSLFIQQYKFSFFFWLDVVATLSLIPDIPYIFDPSLSLFNIEIYQVEVDVHTNSVRDTRLEDYTARVLNSIRFIRLVRIVKLYKYFSRSRVEEEIRDDQPGDMDPRSLGKKLSDVTTRRVIIGVLLMLLLLPMLQVQQVDNAQFYGLQQLFWGGLGCAQNSFQNCTSYLTVEGWTNMIEMYSENSEPVGGGSTKFPLLWLRVPNFADGKIEDIQSAGNWEQDSDCAGKTISSDCNLRSSEMKLVVYSPSICIDGDASCDQLQVFARFDIQESVREGAILNLITTIFVGFILAASSLLFARDTQKIVVEPVNKMVRTVKTLAQEPLKEQTTQSSVGDSILEQTFEKIGLLLQQSFGVRGSEIMNPVLTDPSLDIMKPGQHRDVVIAICSIQNFAAIVDCLQEELLVFTNKIAKIIHQCAKRWGGVPCSNEMGTFLLLWPDTMHSYALFAMIKIQAEVSRALDILAYQSNNKIVTKFGDGFQLNIMTALHSGWIIEGPIGSSCKIDPGYIGHHLDIAEYISSVTEEYSVPLLMSHAFFQMLGAKVQTLCRIVDCLKISFVSESMLLYTFDMIDEVPLPATIPPESRHLGDPVIIVEIYDRDMNPDDLYKVDNDINIMQRNITAQFSEAFDKAIQEYFKGNWGESLSHFDYSLTLKPGDGPSISLKRFIENNSARSPEEWNGCRCLESEMFINSSQGFM